MTVKKGKARAWTTVWNIPPEWMPWLGAKETKKPEGDKDA